MARRCIPDNALRPLFPVTVVQHEEFNSSGTLDTVDNIFRPLLRQEQFPTVYFAPPPVTRARDDASVSVDCPSCACFILCESTLLSHLRFYVKRT